MEHIHISSVGRPDVAHWPNHRPDIDSDCAIPECALLRELSKIKAKRQTREYASTCQAAAGQKKRGRVEIEEVTKADAYADPPPPSSPAEEGAGAPAAVTGAAAEPANSPLAENEEVDAYADPPPPEDASKLQGADSSAGARGTVSKARRDGPCIHSRRGGGVCAPRPRAAAAAVHSRRLRAAAAASLAAAGATLPAPAGPPVAAPLASGVAGCNGVAAAAAAAAKRLPACRRRRRRRRWQLQYPCRPHPQPVRLQRRRRRRLRRLRQR